MRTVVLTSKENFVWISMSEIVPAIERVWKLSETSNHKVDLIDVDDKKLTEMGSILLKADNIVFTVFTIKLSRIANMLRTGFGIDSRFFIYSHGQATIGFWPLYEWGMGDVLRSSDVFISTCSRDDKTIANSFINSVVEVVPFTLMNAGNSQMDVPLEVPKRDQMIHFLYVGRISVQKNLHTLIYSLKLFRDKHPDLLFDFSIYGGEDSLGNPNMEEYFPNYLDYLTKLTNQLDMNDVVIFKGFMEREKLHREIFKKKHVILSASLHADENFGIAILRSLCLGNVAVISDWGGHTDFKGNFQDRIIFVPVRESDSGPYVSPFKMAMAIEKIIRLYMDDFSPAIPDYYNEKIVSEKIYKMAMAKKINSDQLQRTELAILLHEKRNKFLDDYKKKYGGNVHYVENRAGCKIFDTYMDVDVRPFFRTYGMDERNKDLENSENKTIILPWVQVNEQNFVVNDPHRGHFVIETVQKLIDHGYACVTEKN